jgi:hypothetical protein
MLSSWGIDVDEEDEEDEVARREEEKKGEIDRIPALAERMSPAVEGKDAGRDCLGSGRGCTASKMIGSHASRACLLGGRGGLSTLLVEASCACLVEVVDGAAPESKFEKNEDRMEEAELFAFVPSTRFVVGVSVREGVGVGEEGACGDGRRDGGARRAPLV